MKLFKTDSLDRLFDVLALHGYTVVGPTVRDGAIVYDTLDSPADLPVGWTEEQDAGTYRLEKRDDDARFGYVVGPHSWKKFLFPSRHRLWSARRTANGYEVEEDPAPAEKYAFVGVRSCDLHAIGIQDRILSGGEYPDNAYRTLRENCLIVVVNCTVTGGTCFCVSMNTGPKATGGYDLALTEVVDGSSHYFTADADSGRGREILAEMGVPDADPGRIEAAERAVEAAASRMGRALDVSGVKELLYGNAEHKRWDQVAGRCLSCGNCTMVCPTCFCTTVEDTNDVTGDHAERWRTWDSCFNIDFSYIHGGSVRRTTRSRYRQWLTHKIASWQDQFDSMGCVGCGRCITWCPVGIDLTEEISAIRATEKK